MTDGNESWLFICPHCHNIADIAVIWSVHGIDHGYVEFGNTAPSTVLDDVSAETYDDTNPELDYDSPSYYCGYCNEELSLGDILAGRNHYLATATKENT